MLTHRLIHAVTIEERVDEQDPVSGANRQTWKTLALSDGSVMKGVPAEVLTGPGREAIQAAAEYGSLAARITLRWFPGLTQKMRIRWDGSIYNIKTVETDRTGRMEWRLKCEDAGLNEG